MNQKPNENCQKMYLNGQNQKKWKADPNYFSILHENMSPNFFSGPPGLRKWHYLQKFPREKVVTHLKIFLQVIQNFWHGRNACDKKKSGYCLRTSVNCKGSRPYLFMLESKTLIRLFIVVSCRVYFLLLSEILKP